jgi:large subunit ribosomal protein L22
MFVEAKLKSVRITPRKVGMIADQVRNKSVMEALDYLAFSPRQRVAQTLAKLIKSAYANAIHNYKIGAELDQSYIAEILVGPGPTLKRFMARAKGSGSRLLKRTSKVSVTLWVSGATSHEGEADAHEGESSVQEQST